MVKNLKNINNYYGMIIQNIYIPSLNFNKKEKSDIKFPDCINIDPIELEMYKIEAIISSFFIEAFNSLPNFNFQFFKKFFYSFLCFNTEFTNRNENKSNADDDIYKVTLETENINCNYNNLNKSAEKKFLLPENKDKEFCLVLDLDETLIYAQRNFSLSQRKYQNTINKKRIILRPCLQEFLHDMKSLFELIIFSSGTPDYVDPIIKFIEKKEKYFDHILYRHHITLDDDGNNVKNLALIGRDLKKVLIIDDIPRYYHLQKENGINIKPFYGNILSDTKTLKLLNTALKKIIKDAEQTKDIRISLEKFKAMLYPDVINNIE
jgi:Dullard-like phosphatase family protein